MSRPHAASPIRQYIAPIFTGCPSKDTRLIEIQQTAAAAHAQLISYSKKARWRAVNAVSPVVQLAMRLHVPTVADTMLHAVERGCAIANNYAQAAAAADAPASAAATCDVLFVLTASNAIFYLEFISLPRPFAAFSSSHFCRAGPLACKRRFVANSLIARSNRQTVQNISYDRLFAALQLWLRGIFC